MSRVLVVAPHPDDETLGCGGTLLRHVSEGDSVVWLIVTAMDQSKPSTRKLALARDKEIDLVSEAYGFVKVVSLGFAAANLDAIPLKTIVAAISEVFMEFEPEIVYLPYRNDAHSDHTVTFDAVVACSKTFRNPSVKTILAYETLSETNFGLHPEDPGFKPNVFVSVSEFIEKKKSIMEIYSSELKEHPFPRSVKAIESLAILRGSQSGADGAEAFLLIKEIR